MDIKALTQYIESHQDFIKHNQQALDIFEGNLGQYVTEIMEKTLSKSYFDSIKSRIIPINVLNRLVEKSSKVYAYPVSRTSDENQDFVDRISESVDINSKMLEAEEYSFLQKGYALEPYLDGIDPKVRVLPYDRFLPFSTDKKDPTKMTAMIKFMGKVNHKGHDTSLYHFWSDADFIAFTEHGIYEPDMIDNQGNVIQSNPIGRIPFVYGNRAKSLLVPRPDSDMLQLTKMIPIVLSDLGGSIMFQCFTVIYGIDVQTAEFKLSPNAFWDMKSDPKSEKTPSIGTIKPEADVNKVLEYVQNIFTLWLETKGVRVGAVGQASGMESSSGISKIIDEMDTSEIRMKSKKMLRKEEMQLWDLMADMNNYWIDSVPEYREGRVENLELSIQYTEPEVKMTRKEKVAQIKEEYDAGFIDAETVIRELYPDLKGEEFDDRVNRLRMISGQEESNSGEESEA